MGENAKADRRALGGFTLKLVRTRPHRPFHALQRCVCAVTWRSAMSLGAHPGTATLPLPGVCRGCRSRSGWPAPGRIASARWITAGPCRTCQLSLHSADSCVEGEARHDCHRAHVRAQDTSFPQRRARPTWTHSLATQFPCGDARDMWPQRMPSHRTHVRAQPRSCPMDSNRR